MIKLTLRQHSQILGWALVGFGVGNAIDLIRFLLTLGPSSVSADPGAVFASLLLPLIYAVGGIVAGMSIFNVRYPQREIVVAFAVAAFISFPLSTALSVYVLLYLYVINPEPEPAAAPGSET